MDTDAVRKLVDWHREYKEEWDEQPERYVEQDIVQPGRTRRLGMLREGKVKAYLGVQHVDPSRPGWNMVDAPSARFFVSVFLSGRVLTLRTFPTIGEALGLLSQVLNAEDR